MDFILWYLDMIDSNSTNTKTLRVPVFVARTDCGLIIGNCPQKLVIANRVVHDCHFPHWLFGHTLKVNHPCDPDPFGHAGTEDSGSPHPMLSWTESEKGPEPADWPLSRVVKFPEVKAETKKNHLRPAHCRDHWMIMDLNSDDLLFAPGKLRFVNFYSTLVFRLLSTLLAGIAVFNIHQHIWDGLA